jgi:uncharacterized protein YdaU (DUF1376 family)
MGKSPAFQFYAADFKLDTDAMSAEAVGAYTRLLCYSWVNGSAPTDHGELARISGLTTGKFAGIWESLERCWVSDGNGGLVNPRQEKERSRQEEWRRKSAKGGRASVKAKRGNHP